MGSLTVETEKMGAEAGKDKHGNQADEKARRVFVCVDSSYRQFVEVCSSIQGIVAIFLITSGVLQLIWMSHLEEDDPEVSHLSTCRNICHMITISGIIVLIWTITGWIVYKRRAISLSITCAVSSFIIVVLLYFMYSGSRSHYEELHPQLKFCFFIVFIVSNVLILIQALFIFARLKITTEGVTSDSRRFLEKESQAKHKLAFSSDVYHC